MNAGDSENLENLELGNSSIPFQGTQTLQLKENDEEIPLDDDDDLGKVTVSDSELDKEKTHRFTGDGDDADYELRYMVVADPEPKLTGSSIKVTLQAANGYYMSEQGTGLVLHPIVEGSNQQFEVIDLGGGELRGGELVNLRASTGLFVVAEKGGNSGEVRANRREPGQWERFQIHGGGEDDDGVIEDGEKVQFYTLDGGYKVVADPINQRLATTAAENKVSNRDQFTFQIVQ